MKWMWLIVLTSLFLALTGCQPATVGHFSSSLGQATFAPPPGQPIVLDVAELAAQPEAHAGAYVRVSGRYRRAPLLVCEGNARHSPATWMLDDGEQSIGATGFDQLLQPLWPRGLTVTVEGRWQWWRGPVGCGKRAPIQEVWYLAVTKVVSPSPIARVTLTPSGIAGDVTVETPDGTSTPSGSAEESATPTATAADGQPTPTPPPATSAATPTPTDHGDGEGEATATATLTTTTAITATETVTSVTPSPTNTLQPGETRQQDDTGTPTLSPTPTNTLRPGETPQPTNTPSPTEPSEPGDPRATPTQTPTAAPLSIVDQGSLAFQDLQGRTMAENTGHGWQLDIEGGDVITISVAAPIDRDLSLEIQDSEGETVAASNASPAGQIELIAARTFNEGGTYRIIVREVQQRSSAYQIMVLNQFNASLLFSGILDVGETQNDTLDEFTDNFWFFAGESNMSVDITISPTQNNRDVLFKVYGPDGGLLTGSYGPEGWIDNGLNGEPEELLNFALPGTGLYAVHVGESSFEPAGFTIRVTE